MKCAIDQTCLNYPHCPCGTVAEQERDIEAFARCMCLRNAYRKRKFPNEPPDPCPIHPSLGLS